VARKRELLGEDYNPVAARLKRYKESVSDPPSEAADLEDEPASARKSEAERAVEAGAESVQHLVGASPQPVRATQPAREVAAEEAPVFVPRAALKPSIHDEPEPRTKSDRSPPLVSSMRTRVTPEEHRHWTETSYRITGKQNQFSALVRSLLILLENSLDEVEKRRPELHAMRMPPKTDRLGNTMYEYRIAEILYEAIEATGRPKPVVGRKLRG